MTDFPEDRARFESVPAVDGAATDAYLPDDDVDDTWIETRQIDTVPPEPYEVDEYFEESELLAPPDGERYEEEELSVRHRESTLNRFFRQRRERREQESQTNIPAYKEPIAKPGTVLAAEPMELPEAP